MDLSSVKTPFIFAVSGYKNTGKTTLLTQLIPELKSRGYRVAVIKHDGHDFTSDVPETDSYRLQEAGAYGCAVFSKKRLLITKKREEGDKEIHERELIEAFPEADILLIEGLKNSPYPKYICGYPQKIPPTATELADRIEEEMKGQSVQ